MRAMLLLGGVLLVGCMEHESPPLPILPDGVYLAQSAGGNPLPALVLEVHDSASNKPIRVYLLSDSLVIQGGTYIQRAHLESRLDDQLIGRLAWSDHGRFTISGSRADFESEYIQNVSFHAEVGFPTLSISQDLTGEGVPTVHVFAPVRP